MSKKRPVVLNYNGHRVLLDTIANYCSIYVSPDRNYPEKYGVRFYLRTGETVELAGTDEVSRDKVLKFLDDYFKPTYFSGNKCQVCAYREDNRKNKCYDKHDCRNYSGYRGFVRREDKIDANVSSEIRG